MYFVGSVWNALKNKKNTCKYLPRWLHLKMPSIYWKKYTNNVENLIVFNKTIECMISKKITYIYKKKNVWTNVHCAQF